MTKAEELISHMFPLKNFRERQDEVALATVFHAYVLLEAIAFFKDHEIWTKDEIYKMLSERARSIDGRTALIYPNSPYR